MKPNDEADGLLRRVEALTAAGVDAAAVLVWLWLWGQVRYHTAALEVRGVELAAAAGRSQRATSRLLEVLATAGAVAVLETKRGRGGCRRVVVFDPLEVATKPAEPPILTEPQPLKGAEPPDLEAKRGENASLHEVPAAKRGENAYLNDATKPEGIGALWREVAGRASYHRHLAASVQRWAGSELQITVATEFEARAVAERCRLRDFRERLRERVPEASVAIAVDPAAAAKRGESASLNRQEQRTPNPTVTVGIGSKETSGSAGIMAVAAELYAAAADPTCYKWVAILAAHQIAAGHLRREKATELAKSGEFAKRLKRELEPRGQWLRPRQLQAALTPLGVVWHKRWEKGAA
jgi:hypothetical protein